MPYSYFSVGDKFGDEYDDAHSNVGIKGSDIFTHDEVGDPRVVLSTLLVRDANEETVKNLLNKMLDNNFLIDAFVMAFMTRNIRGGKGERDLFYTMYSTLLTRHKNLAIHLLDLVPHYGYWRDLFKLAEKNNELIPDIISIVKKQLSEDEFCMELNKPISIMAKWLPREKKFLAKELAYAISKKSKIQERYAEYRKRVSTLNKYLETTEIPMCKNLWDTITPEKVAARCLQKHMKAFLNETLGGKSIRCPYNISRNKCRENFQEYFRKIAKGEKMAKGSDTLYPHEIINKIAYKLYTKDEKNALIGTWNAFVMKAKEGEIGRAHV